MQGRYVGSVKEVKAKGHAMAEDVLGGNVLAKDKYGNDSADALVVSRALRRMSEVCGRQQRVETALAVQRSMLDIIAARGRATKAAGGNSSRDQTDGCHSGAESGAFSSENILRTPAVVTAAAALAVEAHASRCRARGRSAPAAPD